MNPSMLQSFNPEQFLDSVVDQPFERRTPLPVENPDRPDGLYVGMIKEIKARTWQAKDPDAKNKAGIAWDITVDVQIPVSFQESLKLPPTLGMVDGVMVDTNDAGFIDFTPGKNRRLRMWREALDMNKPGDTFSGRKMLGQPVLVKVRHEDYQGDIMDRLDRPVKFA